jgi:hypothetical protein
LVHHPWASASFHETEEFKGGKAKRSARPGGDFYIFVESFFGIFWVIQSLNVIPFFGLLCLLMQRPIQLAKTHRKLRRKSDQVPFFRANLLADLGRINHLLQFVKRLGFFSIEIHTGRASGAVRRWVTIGKARNSETTKLQFTTAPKVKTKPPALEFMMNP